MNLILGTEQLAMISTIRIPLGQALFLGECSLALHA